MKRILEDSPARGYQLFRWQKQKPDGSVVILPNYYIRRGQKSVSTGTDRLKDAKVAVKKLAGEDAQARRRRTAKPDTITVDTLLDLVIEDYAKNEQKSLTEAKARIQRGEIGWPNSPGPFRVARHSLSISRMRRIRP